MAKVACLCVTVLQIGPKISPSERLGGVGGGGGVVTVKVWNVVHA